jgi:hypothetical protein
MPAFVGNISNKNQRQILEDDACRWHHCCPFPAMISAYHASRAADEPYPISFACKMA